MDYFPNVRAVTFFANEVLPAVREQCPDATFQIVGSSPSADVERLGELEGVEVTGRVPDVRPYLENARVAVTPIDLARGIQNKILEALAMETPVVSSTVAFRGVDANPGDGVLVADSSKDVADNVIRVLRDDELASALAARGRKLVESRYSWAKNLEVLDRILSDLTQSATHPEGVQR